MTIEQRAMKNDEASKASRIVEVLGHESRFVLIMFRDGRLNLGEVFPYNLDGPQIVEGVEYALGAIRGAVEAGAEPVPPDEANQVLTVTATAARESRELPAGFTTANLYGVGANVEGQIAIIGRLPKMTRTEALNLVAWVATLAQLGPREIELARVAIEQSGGS